MLIDGIEQYQTTVMTENGALTYSSSLSHVVDLFGMGAAMRTRADEEKISIFAKAFAEDRLLALKALFYIRDCRGGQGEREFFRVCFRWLAKNYPSIAINNMSNVIKFGRYDDLFVLRRTPIQDQMVMFVRATWKRDVENYKNGKPVSLLAKWMPSENASSKETISMARWFGKKLKLSKRNYRKTLSILRKHIDVVEVKMSKNAWQSINYGKVPSHASKIYNAAFRKHDPVGYDDYIYQVVMGNDKINAKTLYPYDLLHHYLQRGWGSFFDSTINHTIEMQWKSLPDYFAGRDENSLCIVDTSGSMHGTPICVAVSLGIYAAERNKGLFHNCFMTFSKKPALQRIVGDSLLEKAMSLSSAHWDMNTDLEVALRVILGVAKNNHLPESEMIKKLYIISDMEFDRCVTGGTLFEGISKMYKKAGYKLPDIIFWNVNSKRNNLPVRFNQSGVALVSGFSPSIFETVAGAQIKSPADIMLKTLNKERYNSVVV